MKKILIISNYQKSIGGIAIQVDVLLNVLNSTQITSKLFNTKTSSLKRVFLIFELFYKSKNFDIFHIHGCSGFGFFPIVMGVIVGRIKKKKIIITYHGGQLETFLNAYPKFVKYFLNKATILTAPSLYILNIFQKNNIKAILLPNIIQEGNVKFKKRDKIRPSLIVTRSLEEVYNIPLVINAFSKIKKKYSDASLRIVGDGSLKNTLEKKVNESGVKGIEFLGRVENSEIGNILNTSDIYINPTTADNMPLSLFEAFACGLPVISTNVGGLPNFIKDHENGFLINSGDENALIEKVDFILSNQEKIKTIVENAFCTFKEFTWDVLKTEYFKIYKL